VQDAEKCIAMQPKWSKGYSRLGLAKFKSGDLAGAMKAYSAGLALDAGNTQIADGLAEVRPLPRARGCGRGVGGQRARRCL
jgi:predicted TPR repeat methyltransferase